MEHKRQKLFQQKIKSKIFLRLYNELDKKQLIWRMDAKRLKATIVSIKISTGKNYKKMGKNQEKGL